MPLLINSFTNYHLLGYSSYYHFGVVKAHLDAGLLPTVITGTSGGALVAALVCTRTDEELKKLLVPALAQKITACHDDIFVRSASGPPPPSLHNH